MPVSADSQQGHNWLIYGDPGVGKTKFGSTAPKALLIRPPTDNVESIAGTGVQEWVVESHEDLLQVAEYVRHEGSREFDWLLWDTVTLFQELSLHSIMVDLHASKPHREIWAPDKGEFGQNMNRLSAFAREMKAAPINFIMFAHVMRDFDRVGEVVMMPAVQGKGMAEKFCGYMGLVGYMDTYEDKEEVTHRRLRTDKHEGYYAKDSYGVFKGKVIDPTVPKMLSIVGARTPAKAATPAPVKGVAKKATPVKKAPAKKVAAVKKTTKKEN